MKKLLAICMIEAICLLHTASTSAGLHTFPSEDSAVVSSVGFINAVEIGWFWSATRGDMVSESFADPLASVSRAVFVFALAHVPRPFPYLQLLALNGSLVLSGRCGGRCATSFEDHKAANQPFFLRQASLSNGSICSLVKAHLCLAVEKAL
jgi:hypothetical protein